MRERLVLCMALLLAGLGSAAAQQGAATVNGYSAAHRAKAEAAARAAGYTPTKLSDVQAGNVFLWAQKNGRQYYLTVTPDGTVHAGGASTAGR